MSEEGETGAAVGIKKEQLPAELREAVRDFVWRTLAIPAALVFVLSGLSGYAFKSIGDAAVTDRILSMATEISTAKGRMDYSIRETDDLLKRVRSLNDEVSRSQALLKTGDQLKEIAKDLSKSPELIELVTKNVSTGRIQVSEPYRFVEGSSPTPLPSSSQWRFCALTHVAARTDLGGFCSVTQRDGQWLYQTGPRQQQSCAVTCWNF